MQWIASGNLPAKSSANLERAGSAQLYDRGVKLVFVLLAGLALAACARGAYDSEIAAGCTDAALVTDALSAAPAPVRVEGAPVSDCFGKDASAGDVQVVGAAFLESAQRLGREGDAVALGYLIGALRDRDRETQGIHSELLRRLEQEARPFARSPAFDRGLRAGRSSG